MRKERDRERERKRERERESEGGSEGDKEKGRLRQRETERKKERERKSERFIEIILQKFIRPLSGFSPFKISYNSGILRDKTIDNSFMKTPNYDK